MTGRDEKTRPEGPSPGWLDDPDAPPSPEEIAAAQALSRALEASSEHGEQGETALADRALAQALKASYAPVDLPAARHDRLVESAIERAGALPDGSRAPARILAFRARRAYAVVGLLAAAACFALVLGKARPRPQPQASAPAAAARAESAAQASTLAAQTPLVPCRSTQDLFDGPFPREGGASARVDKIAAARARDLRENRFARWGVR